MINSVLNQKYKVESQIGKGGFSVVYKAINLNNNEIVAVKKVSRRFFHKDPKTEELYRQEIQILKSIQSENTIRFIDEFETDEYSFIVTDFCNGGTLQDVLQKQRIISEPDTIEYFVQLLNAFKHLHQKNIVHRDIKLENIMLHTSDKTQVLKIIDFGLSKIISDLTLAQTQAGTPFNMAPEIMLGKDYGLEVDVYSVGVILYQMLFGNYPFTEQNSKKRLDQIKSGQINFNLNGVQISKEMRDLIQKMLTFSQNDRIKWFEIYNHSIVNQMLLSHKSNKKVYDTLLETKNQAIQFYQNTQFKQEEINILEHIRGNSEINSLFNKIIGINDLKFTFNNQDKENSQIQYDSQIKSYQRYINNYKLVLYNVKLMVELPEGVRNNYLIFIQLKLGFILISKLYESFEDGFNLLSIRDFDKFAEDEQYQQLQQKVNKDYILFSRAYNTSIQELKKDLPSLYKINAILCQNISNELDSENELSLNFKEIFLSIFTYQKTLVKQHINICFGNEVVFDQKVYFISFILAYEIFKCENKFSQLNNELLSLYQSLKQKSLDELLVQFKQTLKNITNQSIEQ